MVIKLADNIELNIRGILASCQNEKWFFRMPFKNGTCHKTGKTVNYPIISFTDQELNRVLLNAIYEKAPIFINYWLDLHPQPLEIVKTLKQSEPPANPKSCKAFNPIAKKTTSTEVKPTALAKNIEWKDPPLRNTAFSKGKPAHSYR